MQTSDKQPRTGIQDGALPADDLRYRQIFEGANEGICLVEVLFDENGRPHDCRFIEANPAFKAQTGLHEPAGRTMHSLAPDHFTPRYDIYGEVAASGSPRSFEHEAARAGRCYEVHVFRVGPAELRQIAILFRDVTARKRVERELGESEARLQRLLAELQHRVRNTLAVVRSIARRSAESSRTVEDYAMHLDGRIAAYARIQAAMTRDLDSGIDLGIIVADTLQSALAREGEQVRISGPQIILRSKAAETIGLALHELTTNALKFGALASPDGHIGIAWRVIDGARETPMLVLRWTEIGLAEPVRPPLHAGFGTEQLTKTLRYDLDAEATLDVRGGRIDWHIRIPLSERVLAPSPA